MEYGNYYKNEWYKYTVTNVLVLMRAEEKGGFFKCSVHRPYQILLLAREQNERTHPSYKKEITTVKSLPPCYLFPRFISRKSVHM